MQDVRENLYFNIYNFARVKNSDLIVGRKSLACEQLNDVDPRPVFKNVGRALVPYE